MMISEKCCLRIKVVRLLLIIGAFLSVVTFLIYSLPKADHDPITAFNPSLFNDWSLGSLNLRHYRHGGGGGNSKINTISTANRYSGSKSKLFIQSLHQNQQYNDRYINADHQNYVLRNKIKRLTAHRLQNDDAIQLINATKKLPKHSAQNVHIFYTIPVVWNRLLLSHDQQQQRQQTTAFYPMLGLYATDNQTIRHHFKNIAKIGVGVVILSWSSEQIQEQLLAYLFDEATQHDIQIAIEIDNYPNRTVHTIFNDIQYFYKEFGQHQSLYKVYVSSKDKYLPMFYIKSIDSQSGSDWKQLFSPNGEMTLRSDLHDAVFIGHISTRKDVSIIKTSQFNGFYSRLVSNGATYGSTWKYWSDLKKSADKFKLLFIPTVGPGYDENNKKQLKMGGTTRRHRTNGKYYGVAWRAAINIGAQFINVASYNDWQCGTQIEEAIPKSGYKDYSPGSPNKYLDLTRYWINEYIQSWSTETMKRIVDPKLCNSYFNNTVC